MKEIEFNLLDEPWIRVRDDSCQVHEVSLTDALLHAHQYTSLSGELPTQDIVILRLMLAVLHTVFSRVDADGNAAELEDEEEAVERWTDLWELGQLPEEPIREYLENGTNGSGCFIRKDLWTGGRAGIRHAVWCFQIEW